MARVIVVGLRLPRVLLAIMIGMALSLAGALLQAVMRNPLADPGIIGVSAGAAAAATSVMLLFPRWLSLVPLVAFVGALFACVLIYLMAWRRGIDPVRIYVETKYVRASRGGMGAYKTGGNYAASLIAQEEAEKQGYSQVLWLDGVHRKYIEEVGSMNVMFKVAGKILTPDLNGSVLDGITRRSCIQLLKDWGYEVEERRISAEELFEAAENGTLEEAWGTGTAAVVSPIGELAMDDKKVTVSNNQIGPVTQKLYDALTDIQWGRAEDPHNWIMKLC